METWEEFTAWYSNQDVEQRKNWYALVADAYHRVRPVYSKTLINRVVELTQLSDSATLLELGCGPGTATQVWASLGFELISLEPNPNFYQLAQQTCQRYASVNIENISFEEYPLNSQKFDAVLAATSFHWIPANIRYQKTVEALKEDGVLILLWNTQLCPQYEVYQRLKNIYKIHAPTLGKYEDQQSQEQILRSFSQDILDSGYFTDLKHEQFVCKVTYSISDYLTLLSTYSPYIELDAKIREALFKDLKETLENNVGESLELSYLSAFHLARKI